MQSLSCCSDGVRGRGAPIANLSHSASFYPDERISPSNRGIKHLGARQTKHLAANTIEPKFATPERQSELDSFAEKLAGWLKTKAGKSRKERRTVKKLHADLVALGFIGSYARVAAFARRWRSDRQREQQTTGRRTFVPLHFDPGDAFQFDWKPDHPIRAGHLTRTLALIYVCMYLFCCYQELIMVPPVELPPKDGWFLILMIWGDLYTDTACNALIRSTVAHSKLCAGVVVLTDRTDRAIDPLARQVLIASDFNLTAFKQLGLPIKISMFDIPSLPREAHCIYVDLDSIVLGSLDKIAGYIRQAPIFTMEGSRPFSRRWRLIARLTGSRFYALGNASFFAYRNGFFGNPTEQFRKFRDLGKLADWPMRDERFVAKCCQEVIRGISASDVVNFKREFLARTLWLATVRSFLRRRLRQNIRVITFTGKQMKQEALLSVEHGAIITDNRRRVGRWDQFHTSGLKEKIITALRA